MDGQLPAGLPSRLNQSIFRLYSTPQKLSSTKKRRNSSIVLNSPPYPQIFCKTSFRLTDRLEVIYCTLTNEEHVNVQELVLTDGASAIEGEILRRSTVRASIRKKTWVTC